MIRSWRGGRLGRAALVIFVIGLFATCAGLGQQLGLPWPGWPERSAAEQDEPSTPVANPPIRLTIRAIDVSAPVRAVGLARDGSIAVPPLSRHNEAGWFNHSPAPGQVGPAILVGHVDTRTGPSVFHDLGRLRRGDAIEVTLRGRASVTFTVDSVERFNKTKLPAQRVYGDYTRPGLRLISCGGRWVGGSTGYADNVVVFASMVDSREGWR